MTLGANKSVELPNPFVFRDGMPVVCKDDWPMRRKELLDLCVDIEYGGMPPTPDSTALEILHVSQIRWMPGAQFLSCRVVCEGDKRFSFLMTLHIPAGAGPFPVVLTGDACWRYVTDKLAKEVVNRGMILAQFNRVEIAPDMNNSERDQGIYPIYPGEYGALSAWAWGYHRCVDALQSLETADAGRIAIVGHSRGGKASLLAGATDERIALTSANGSGAGGAGCYRCQGPNSEHLSDSLRAFPYWYGPKLGDYLGRETELPFDQHYLKSAVAPRALLTTEALGDLWANPSGTWQTHLATREVYRFLGVESNLAIHYREGEHEHSEDDWQCFLDFMEWKLCGKPQPAGSGQSPFPEQPKDFSWRAPGS
jgi:hypothetical protein